ncbi:LytTR family DNA-binding domain-containing protein [Sphingobacterium sp. DR205]|uniref:LytR/AlgR family response regulator transcription factor n=1 Tax=Sphingobacterium sp. DR205 TaxID=2713573 RepID=UPI0013E518B0|nr:LytTR family DNA-binding domain-containing protein [Sphingobacterium sp. DR205]QIH35937.1 response regulator transcription factor [Sphingobacterium sp. DR205]
MLNALIIEDELPNIQRLEKMLSKSSYDITVIKSIQTVKDSMKWLGENKQPDLIFMDIMLTDGISFEIFEHVDIAAPVIFVTAYDEYALKAFEVNGIDYLLKPLESEKLEKSIRKAIGYRSLDDNIGIISLMKKMQTNQRIYRSRFLVSYRDRFLSILVDDVAYFISENRITYLIMKDSQRYVIDATLEVLDAELDPEVFIRISRQFIVSFGSIESIYQLFNSQLKISLKPQLYEPVTLSRDRSSIVKKWLDKPGN